MINKFQPGDYRIMQISSNKYQLTHIKGKDQFILTMIDDTFSINFEGMPEKFKGLLREFSRAEILEDPLFILQSVFKT